MRSWQAGIALPIAGAVMFAWAAHAQNVNPSDTGNIVVAQGKRDGGGGGGDRGPRARGGGGGGPAVSSGGRGGGGGGERAIRGGGGSGGGDRVLRSGRDGASTGASGGERGRSGARPGSTSRGDSADRGRTRVDRGARPDGGVRIDRSSRSGSDRPWRRGVRYFWGPGAEFWFWNGYYYGDCNWLLRRARATGSSYWWNRYRQCRWYY